MERPAYVVSGYCVPVRANCRTRDIVGFTCVRALTVPSMKRNHRSDIIKQGFVQARKSEKRVGFISRGETFLQKDPTTNALPEPSLSINENIQSKLNLNKILFQPLYDNFISQHALEWQDTKRENNYSPQRNIFGQRRVSRRHPISRRRSIHQEEPKIGMMKADDIDAAANEENASQFNQTQAEVMTDNLLHLEWWSLRSKSNVD